jgi:hypothetical protein
MEDCIIVRVGMFQCHRKPGERISTVSVLYYFRRKTDMVKSKGKVVPLRHEGVCGSGLIDPHCLVLGTSWR